MVTVMRAERRSPVLSPSSLACLSHIPTINLTAGCSIGCVYCYTLGYSSNPGEGKILLYENTLEKLKAELSSRGKNPRAVFFSPSSDLFQPVPEVLTLGYQVLEFLFSKGIGVVFLTKGQIPDNTMDILLGHSGMVKAEIWIIALDEEIALAFEPNAGHPKVRLQQISKLISGGVPTEARVDPILPGVTDSPDVLVPLFSSLAEAGVTRVAASTLFLRPAISESLKRSVSDKKVLEDILDFYRDSRRLPIRAEHSTVVSLGQEDRQQIFERVRSVAKEHGIAVSVCACKNPDLASGTCGINGNWPQGPRRPLQRRLSSTEA
jgi:DNA repair photolyase